MGQFISQKHNGGSQLELINNHTDDVGASKTQDMIHFMLKV